MHNRFLVTFEKELADDSKRAREYVNDFLVKEGFTANRRWACGLADWFVIGGRWGGELSEGGPEDRDRYELLGYEDDAMILTEGIYNRLLKDFEGSADELGYADFEFEPCSREMIGKKWIVVVDYHD